MWAHLKVRRSQLGGASNRIPCLWRFRYFIKGVARRGPGRLPLYPPSAALALGTATGETITRAGIKKFAHDQGYRRVNYPVRPIINPIWLGKSDLPVRQPARTFIENLF